jgi:hypothetical protein
MEFPSFVKKDEMKTDLTKNKSILESVEYSAFRLKTQQQVARDFAKVQCFFPENFKEESLPKDEIERLISIEVETEMKKVEQNLLQLLYIIDLPEKKFIHLTTQADFLARLSEQILFREAYKVWLRENYSK